jgi:hypothetical protein
LFYVTSEEANSAGQRLLRLKTRVESSWTYRPTMSFVSRFLENSSLHDVFTVTTNLIGWRFAEITG